MLLSLADTAHARLLPSQDEMRSFDEKTIASGITALDLMERAGEAIFREIKERFSFELYSNGKVVILAGPGNNGGDGFVIARHMKEHGYEVSVILASHSNYSPELIAQLAQFKEKDGVIFQYRHASADVGGHAIEQIDDEQISVLISQSALVIDALLGTGQKAAPRGVLGELLVLVETVIASLDRKPKVVAVDTPTGVNGDTGAVYNGALRADLTVAVELLKRGMLQYPARRICGEIWCVSIDLRCDKAVFSLVDGTNVPRLPLRSEESHKGKFGSVLVVGGSEDMPGAPMLSTRASLRLGAGSVVKAHLRGTPVVDMPAEAMLLHLGENDRHYTPRHLSAIESAIIQSNATVIGPGIGTQPETKEFVRSVIEIGKRERKTLVIDADALNCMAQLRVAGESIECPGAVLTPHPGEMGRLLGMPTERVQSDRYQAAIKLAEITNATVVLKGASTVIVSGDSGWVNTTGNPWLAVPGSGDVLAGIIAAFIAQGMTPAQAARTAVYFHGQAGDLLEQRGAVPCTANDIIVAAAPLAIA